MANPNRDTVIDNLITAIQGINGSSPYTTTVAHVQRKHMTSTDIPVQHMPFVGIEESDEEYEGIRFHHYKVRFQVDLLIQVVSDGEAAARQLLNDVYDDVFHAINVDYTRGNQAYETKVTATSPTEIVNRNIAQMHVLLEILYVRNTVAS